MTYNVHGILSNGSTVFRGNLTFLPRIDEEIETGLYLFKVEKVTYIIADGTSYGTNVRLLLKQVR